MEQSFRVQCKQFFLTYAQCPLDKDDILATLRLLLLPQEPIAGLAGHELHSDGGHHIHVYIKTTHALSTRDCRYFDIDGYHPNIVTGIRNPKATWDYCSKENDFSSFGECPTDKANKQSRWLAVKDAATAAEAWEAVWEADARDAILYHDKIKDFIDKMHLPSTTLTPYEARPLNTFLTPPQLTAWIDQMVGERPLSLVLFGPTRLGKTDWARAVGPHMYFNGMFDLSAWSDNAAYAVFDDFDDWAQWRSWKQWLGAQHEFTVTDKYMRKRTIRWGKPCILLSNDLPIFKDMIWLRANCFVVEVLNKMFI